jgi:hypothetical protein
MKTILGLILTKDFQKKGGCSIPKYHPTLKK